jgi:hypothetical protein
VPKPGFEPGHPCGRQTLNLVRLPVPPLRPDIGMLLGVALSPTISRVVKVQLFEEKLTDFS